MTEVITDKISKTPLALPAVFAVLCASVMYLTGNMLFVMPILIILSVLSVRYPKMLFSGFLAMLVAASCVVRMNGYHETGNDETYLEARIVSVEHKADGSRRILVRTSSGDRLMVYDYGSWSGIEIGDHIEGTFKVSFPDPPGNPWDYDLGNYLRRRGIEGLIASPREDLCIKHADDLLSGIIRRGSDICYQSRLAVIGLFDDYGPYASGLFMGDTTLLDDSSQRAFRLSNCSHLLAVSGTHFAGFLMALPAILDKLKVKKKHAIPVYIAFCILTGAFTGWSGSVTRAMVMSSCAFASRDGISGMSFASIVIALEDPYSLVSLGFLLSFGASLGIRLFSRGIGRRLEKKEFPRKLSDIISVILAAQLGMMPFWQDTGTRLSLMLLPLQFAGSLLAQTACVFFVPCVLLSFLFGRSFSAPVRVMFFLLKRLTSVGAGSSLSAHSGKELPLPWILIIFAIIVMYLMPPSVIKRVLFKPFLFVATAVSAVCIAASLTGPEIKVVFADVGQGDCCLIMSGGKSVMIDGGTYKEGEDTVIGMLDWYGIDKPDLIVMTHWDADHGGGIAALYENGRTGKIVSCIGRPSESVPEMECLYDRVDTINAGDIISISEDAVLRCISPSFALTGENEDSIVLVLETRSCRILFTGDIGAETESRLIDEGLISDIDILKAAHHGSRYSTSEKFLDACSPEFAVISAGLNNSYGHPAPETMERLSREGAYVMNTAYNGAITAGIYADRYTVEGYRDNTDQSILPNVIVSPIYD